MPAALLSQSPIAQITDEIIYVPVEKTRYLLKGLIPEGTVLVANPEAFQLDLLTIDADGLPDSIGSCTLTPSEWRVSIALIAAWDNYCPYEVVYANFNWGTYTEETLKRARKTLERAMDNGTWDGEMRPVRNVLSRSRLKFQVAFGFTITSILEVGYTLHPGVRKHRPKR
jgi:hypothetical protein